MSALTVGSPHLSFYDYINMVDTNTDEDNQYWTHLVADIAAGVKEQECYD